MNEFSKEENREIRNVTLKGALLDLALGIMKMIIGKITFSSALITDGVHSLSDLVTDGFVLLLTRISSKGPDSDHPYGHKKFETLGTIIIGLALSFVALILIQTAMADLISPQNSLKISHIAIAVTIFSILSKEYIYHATIKVARKYNSSLLIANAWHSRTDSISSIIVLIGLVFSYFGYFKADKIAAILVSLIIFKISFTLIWSSFKELVDSSVSPDVTRNIHNIITNTKGVRDYHNLRTRLMGGKVIIDVNIEVDNHISVSEGHQIATWLTKTLIESIENLVDVTVHIDTEFDLDQTLDIKKVQLLPLRDEVEKDLIPILSKHLGDNFYDQIIFHYFEKDISIDVFYSSNEITQKSYHLISDELSSLYWFGEITFYKKFKDDL